MVGDVVAGRYRLDERVAVGGMGEVWAAFDVELDRRVAVKLLQPTADRARFEREARAAAGLSHPNVCRLYDFGEADGRPYIVLEYLPGGTLENLLASGEPLPPDEAARIASEVASGLAHAHERGLVHRDMKPGNVLFDDEGRAKITDFGIARVEGASTLTEAGTLLGTAAYFSPEQASSEPATPASDVYSFGVILYRILTGRLPFEAESPLELAAKHVNDEPPAVLSVRPDAPPELARVAAAALAKQPKERPADGNALVAALAGGRTTGAVAPATSDEAAPGPTEVIPVRRRWGARTLAGGAALLALAGGGVAAALLGGQEPSEAPANDPATRARPTTGASKGTPPGTETTAPPTTRARPPAPPRATATTPSPPPTTEAAPTTAPVPEVPTTVPPVTTDLPLPTTEPEAPPLPTIEPPPVP